MATDIIHIQNSQLVEYCGREELALVELER